MEDQKEEEEEGQQEQGKQEEMFTFAQLSMMAVGTASSWHVGEENETLVDVVRSLDDATTTTTTTTTTTEESDSMPPLNSPLIIDQLLIANIRFYPTLRRHSKLKQGCFLRVPQYSSSPSSLPFLAEPRPTYPPPHSVEVLWVCCETCNQWRIVAPNDYAALLTRRKRPKSCQDPNPKSQGSNQESGQGSSQAWKSVDGKKVRKKDKNAPKKVCETFLFFLPIHTIPLVDNMFYPGHQVTTSKKYIY